MSAFKDLFSQQSKDYAKFRPHYPRELFQYLASLVNERSLAWDCGTGSGQAAIGLAEYFDRVIATDPSEKQLVQAAQHYRVEYQLANAESPDIPAQSVDIVTVAQALHWFRQNEFFATVKRVLKPEGVLAVWCYELANITPGIDAVVHDFYSQTLGEYWDEARRMVEDGYRSIHFPFREIAPSCFEMTTEWSLDHFVGYLGTWSALQKFIEKNGTNPLESIYPQLKNLWGKSIQRVSWPLSLRVFQNN